MKRLAMFVIIVVFLFLSNAAYGQESFKFAKKRGEMVTVYLERLKVKDPSRKLNDRERHELCRFFLRAYVVAKRRGVDELLAQGAPIFRLFWTNFPKVDERVRDEGIFLGQIARFINTVPEYRADVEQELRRDIATQRCTPY
jgi:hypothetical protein